MASNAPAATGASHGPLSSFERVSKIVYLYRPSTGRNPSGSSSSPKLILVGGWMDAREPHLAKYTAKLQALYPDSPIVLVRSFVYHFTGGRFPAEIRPAVPLVRSILAESGGFDRGEGGGGSAAMLVHLFSNGGSTMLRLLYDLYRESAAKGEPAGFPPHVTVFDSAPGRWQWTRSVTAFSLAVAQSNLIIRALVKALAHCLSAFYWLFTVPWGRAGFLERTWLAHNDKTINGAENRRVYIYGREDRLVDYRDVQEHAAQARQRGYEVALEEFEGTAHVAHARGDEQRYWTIVKNSWDSSLAK